MSWRVGCRFYIESVKDELTALAKAESFDELGMCREKHAFWKTEGPVQRTDDDDYVIPEDAKRP